MKKREIMVLMGVSGSGKTTVARKIVEERGCEYINFVATMRTLRESGMSYPNILDYIAKRVNANTEKDFVLDGYHIHRETSLKRLDKNLKHHRIKPVVVFADPEIIADRKTERSGREHAPESVAAVRQVYIREFASICDMDATMFVDTTDGMMWSSQKKMMDVMEGTKT